MGRHSRFVAVDWHRFSGSWEPVQVMTLGLSDYACLCDVVLSREPLASGGQGLIYEDRGGTRVFKMHFNEYPDEDPNSFPWRKLPPHSHVLPLLGASFHDGHLYTLAPRLSCNARQYVELCPTVDVRALILDTARGLLHLRAHGYEHNDIKGVNIGIDCWGRAVIIDLDSLASEATRQHVPSTMYWRAPEAWSGLNEDLGPLGSLDVWALGCTTLELYTHENPFSDIKYPDLLDYLRAGKYRTCPDIARKRGLDPLLWELVLQMLDLDPHNRPIALQVIERLESLIFTQSDALLSNTPSTNTAPDLPSNLIVP